MVELCKGQDPDTSNNELVAALISEGSESCQIAVKSGHATSPSPNTTRAKSSLYMKLSKYPTIWLPTGLALGSEPQSIHDVQTRG